MNGKDLESRLIVLFNTNNYDQERTSVLWLLQSQGQLEQSIIERLMSDNSTYLRCSLAMVVGYRSERSSYNLLLRLINDKDESVRESAILALGVSKDSRAIFALANYFQGASYQIKKAIIHSLVQSEDPRVKDFLNYVSQNDTELKAKAETELLKYKPKEDFRYTFASSEEMFEKAKAKTGQIVIESQKSLEDCKDIMDQAQEGVGHIRPQTYVITLDRKLVIGGLLGEHVYVAKGEDVLAAGEIIFEKDSDTNKWFVKYVNNRSNGYYPARECFVHVKNALDAAQIDFDGKEFSEVFPKDGYFTEDFLRDKSLFGHNLN